MALPPCEITVEGATGRGTFFKALWKHWRTNCVVQPVSLWGRAMNLCLWFWCEEQNIRLPIPLQIDCCVLRHRIYFLIDRSKRLIFPKNRALAGEMERQGPEIFSPECSISFCSSAYGAERQECQYVGLYRNSMEQQYNS